MVRKRYDRRQCDGRYDRHERKVHRANEFAEHRRDGDRLLKLWRFVVLASAQVYVVAPGSVEPTLNPQVALYTITPPVAANVTIQFGPTTSYGKSTWTQGSPTGGGPVGTYVAGMLANTAYHMQATVQFPGGVTYTDMDHTFTTGTPPAAGFHHHGHDDAGDDSSEWC